MKIIFMGTPAFAVPCLQSLIDSKHQILAVYTQPPRPANRGQKTTPSPIQQLAEKYNIPCFHPVSLREPEIQAEFAALKADIAVVVAYGLLLPPAILAAFPYGCINVHPSKLPRWRGAAPIQRTIMAGDEKTAIGIMQMEAGLDTGPLWLEKDYPLSTEITAGQLHDQLANEAGDLILQALEKINSGGSLPIPQSSEGVLYASKIQKSEYSLDWSKPAEELYNQIRGLSPTPNANFTWNKEVIKIHAATWEKSAIAADYGTILDEHLAIKCGKDILRPTILQRPGKTPISYADFLRGNPIPIGSQLPVKI